MNLASAIGIRIFVPFFLKKQDVATHSGVFLYRIVFKNIENLYIKA